MTEYPPEVQAVLDAAERLAETVGYQTAFPNDIAKIRDAVVAYRKSIAPPEPFTAYLHFLDVAISDPDDGYWYIDQRAQQESSDDDVWKVTVTPIERVR